MRGFYSATIIFLAVSFTARGAGLTDCGLHKTECRDLIGKRLWVVVPQSNPNSVEVSPTQSDYTNTLKMRTGSFLVKDVIPNKSYGNDFYVALPNDKTGYVDAGFSWIFLSETDPAENARKRVAEEKVRQENCARRGQPKIGMTMDEAIATCWGKPGRVVKTTTAAAVQQDFIYGRGHVLRFENGNLTAILETAGQ